MRKRAPVVQSGMPMFDKGAGTTRMLGTAYAADVRQKPAEAGFRDG